MSESEIISTFKQELARQTALIKQELDELRREIKEVNRKTEQRIFEVEKRVSAIEVNILELKRAGRKNNIVVSGLNLNDSEVVNSTREQLNELIQTDLRIEHFNNQRVQVGKIRNCSN